MKKQSSPINSPLPIKQKVIDLIARREKWEANEYNSSKVILYGLLAECREIMVLLSLKDAADMRAFNDLLEDHDIVMNSGTPIETRIVRLVFGDCGRRAHIYSNVLKHAKAQGIMPKDLAEWIIRERGIENVGHNKSSPASKKVMRQELIKLASAKLENTPFLAEVGASEVLEPSSDNYVSLSLAFVRKAPDGKFGVVYGINRISLIETALAVVGKELELAKTASDTVADANKSEATRRGLRHDLVSKAKTRARPRPQGPVSNAA